MREIAAEAEDVSRFPYAPTVIFGHLRLLAGMVRANRPWRLAARLYGVLAAAMPLGAYGIVASDMEARSIPQLVAAPGRMPARCGDDRRCDRRARTLGALASSRARAQVLLFNVTTVLTVTIGLASLYAGSSFSSSQAPHS